MTSRIANRNGSGDSSITPSTWMKKLGLEAMDDIYLNDHAQLYCYGDPITSGDFLATFKLVSECKSLKSTLNAIDIRPQSGLKCEKMAVAHRGLGLKQMAKGKLNFALKSMNLSVILSPVIPDEKIDKLPTALSSAYNIRSQVLYKMNKYHECISDVLHALKSGCADNEIADLFERQALCCEQLNEFDKAVECYNEAIAKASNRNKNRLKRSSRNVKMKARTNANYAKESLLHTDFNPVEWKPVPPLHDNAHSETPSVSSALRIVRGGVQGLQDIKNTEGRVVYSIEFPLPEDRYFVAAKDIDAGSVIVVEKPFAWSLRKSDLYNHCGDCGRHCEVVTPCRGCAAAVYCCDECEQRAWNDHHQLECVVLPYLQSFPAVYNDIDTCDMLVVLLKTLCRFITKPPTADSAISTDDLVEHQMFQLPVYEVTPLAACFGDMISAATNVCFLLKLLDLNHALEKCLPSQPLSEAVENRLKKLCVARLLALGDALPHIDARFSRSTLTDESARNLLGALLISVGVAFIRHCRPLPIVSPHSIANGETGMYSRGIGFAFYPSTTLFSKSCYPHADVYIHGHTCVVRVVRHIPEGEQITISRIDCIFPQHDFETRRQKFGAEFCACPPCAAKMSACDQLSTPFLRCPRCSEPVRGDGDGSSSVVCAGCGFSAHHEHSALSRDWNDAQIQLRALNRLPSDTPQLLERFLQLYVPIDRRIAEPFMTSGHKEFVNFLKKIFFMNGNYVHKD